MTEAPAQGRGARSRDAILDTAGELMARHGYAATSISVISAACGLPVSSLYWHFGSKEVRRGTGAGKDHTAGGPAPGRGAGP